MKDIGKKEIILENGQVLASLPAGADAETGVNS
jgi:hypothetical protein